MFFELLYVNLFSTKTLFTLTYMYLVIQFCLCQSLLTSIFLGFLILLSFSGILLFFGAELFGTLLLLAEFIVFFYIFCIYLTTTHSFSKKKSMLFLLPLLFLCSSSSVGYIDYFFKNWYITSFYTANDVTVIFLTVYHYYPTFLLLVGEFLTIVTIALMLWFNTILVSKGSSPVTQQLVLQSQLKDQQIAKKALIFKVRRSDI